MQKDFKFIIIKWIVFQCLDAGLYLCANCDRYIPTSSKKDWIQHQHDYHEFQYNQLVEQQRLLTTACNKIQVDDHQVISI